MAGKSGRVDAGAEKIRRGALRTRPGRDRAQGDA